LAEALQRTNSLHRYVKSLGVEEAINCQRQVAEDVKVIRKIEGIEKQLKQSITEGFEQSTNKQFDAIERVRTEQPDYEKIIEQILSELQSIKKEINIGKQLLSGDVKRQLQNLEKEQEKAEHEAAKHKELHR